MHTISATYRVVTPLFMGGADSVKSSPEIRLTSFKGVLRFWWRALAWQRLNDVATLRRAEANLFGSSDENQGQSKVVMRLDRLQPDPQSVARGTQFQDRGAVAGQGLRYLGYGVMEAFERRDKTTREIKAREAQLLRPCLLAPFNFRISLLLKRSVSCDDRDALCGALRIAGLCGGLGSKARKGYGSLTLIELRDRAPRDRVIWTAPTGLQELQQELSSLLQARSAQPAADIPDWTAFSAAARLILVAGEGPSGRDTPLAMLDRIGREMLRFRSSGRNGKILGRENVDSERRFQDDHDLMKLGVSVRMRHPRRIVFGLPHNYGKEGMSQVEPADRDLDRRASPLLLHIHHVADGAVPVGVLTFLPATFLPVSRSEISVGGKQVPLNSAKLWQPVHAFLDRLLDPKRRREPFATVIEV